MLLLQADLAQRDNGDAILLSAATKLVELECIEDDGVLQWWEDAKSSESEQLEKVKGKTQQLIDYLNESEEESDEDDEDDDEDSE